MLMINAVTKFDMSIFAEMDSAVTVSRQKSTHVLPFHT